MLWYKRNGIGAASFCDHFLSFLCHKIRFSSRMLNGTNACMSRSVVELAAVSKIDYDVWAIIMVFDIDS